LILLGVPPLGGYNYITITPRCAGLSATARLSCVMNFGVRKLESWGYQMVMTSWP